MAPAFVLIYENSQLQLLKTLQFDCEQVWQKQREPQNFNFMSLLPSSEFAWVKLQL